MTCMLQWRGTEMATKIDVCFAVISTARQRRFRDAELLNLKAANFCVVAKYK